MDVEATKISYTDKQALELVQKYTPCKNTTEFQKLDKKEKSKYIVQLLGLGLSARQINRVCGVSKYKVDKINKEMRYQGL